MEDKRIQRLSDLEVVRNNPAIYGGSDDIDGTIQTFKEVLNNTVDLYMEEPSYNKIYVEYSPKDSVYSIRDIGVGLPVEWNEGEQEYDYNLVLFTLNAGGNYENNERNQVSIGEYGVGLSYSIMSSEWAKVIVIRGGVRYEIEIKEGVLESIEEEKTDDPSGTFIQIKPSDKVFTDIEIPEDGLIQYLNEQTVTNKGFKIEYTNTDTGKTMNFYHEEGIKDYIKEVSEDKEFTEYSSFESDFLTGRDADNRDSYESQYNFVYTFNNENYGDTIFHNSSKLTEESSQHKSIRLAFVYEIDALIKRLGLYNKNESKIGFEDIRESLLIVVNTYSTQTSYKNQTKKGINNLDIQRKLNELLKQNLQVFFIENESDAEKIAKQVLINKRSRERAERSRVDVRKRLTSENVNTVTNKIEDYYPTKKNDGSDSQYLAIVEGKSALSSIVYGRDANSFAVYPIRGKSLNVRKQSKDRIMNNKEIQDIYNILGCGVDLGGKVGSKSNNFDIDNLRFDRIYIYADADEDGNHITGLLLSIFDTLSPELIKQGKIYKGVTPLYTVLETTNDKIHFAYSDEELEEVKKKVGNKKHTISRNKGLGTLSNEEITLAMDVESPHHIKYVYDEDALETLDLWFKGDAKERRKMMFEDYEED